MSEPDAKTISEIGPVWRELWGQVWHVTRPDLFLRIRDDNAVKPEPEVPDDDRWGTAEEPSHYPYVRSIGGVSLFDFRDFDPDSYQEQYKNSHWRFFVPIPKNWAGAVWIEINLDDIEPNFITGSQLVADRNSSEEYHHMIMPHIEAAHKGPLTLEAVRRVIFIRERDNGDFHKWDLRGFDRAAYEALLPGWQEDYDIEIAIKNKNFDQIPENRFLKNDGINLLAAMRDASKR